MMFPAGLPAATADYLVLYILTLTAHLVFMSYVLAGSGYLAASSLMRERDAPDLIAAMLRDWLPFALGVAITLGVAPLLFVQILYQESFYTANLLLFHRWMAIVPVLMVGFYLLYLGKSKLATRRWGRRGGALVSVGAFACFGFAAYSWTENHLLALDRDAWAGHYAAGRYIYAHAEIAPRVLMWLAMAVPVMAVTVGLQLVRGGRDAAAGRLSYLALGGLVTTVIAAAAYVSMAGVSTVVTSPSALPYAVLAACGLAAQAGVWIWHMRAGRLSQRALIATAAAAALMILGVVVVRECIRLGTMDLSVLAPLHERAAAVGGTLAFLCFFAINTGLIAWCFAMTRRALRERESGQP